MAEIKQCLYCAEDIKVAAIVCKHCGRELPGFSELSPESDSGQELTKNSESDKTLGNSHFSESLQEINDEVTPKSQQHIRPLTAILAFIFPAWGIIVGAIYMVRTISRKRGVELVGISLLSTAVFFFVLNGWDFFSNINAFDENQNGQRNQVIENEQQSSEASLENAIPTATLESIYIRVTEGAGANCKSEELIEWSNEVSRIVDEANTKAEELGVVSPETITIENLVQYSEFLDSIKNSINKNIGPPCVNMANNWIWLAYLNFQEGINAIVAGEDDLASEFLDSYDQKLTEFEVMHENLLDAYLVEP